MQMIQEYLSSLFEQHGLSCVIHEDWVAPNGGLPGIRAYWYPDGLSGELDFQILVRENVIIEECYAGMGEDGDAALKDALSNFTTQSFHALFAALWGIDHEEVYKEDWDVQGKQYTVYSGNYGIRRIEPAPSDEEVPLSDLFSRIEGTIRQEHLKSDIHWFRLFFSNWANELSFEALKDNEIWEAGIRCLKSVSWPRCKGYYSMRLFIILRERDWQPK